MIDYHIHTPFCNHAKGSMIEFIESSIDKGLKEICFLDHLILADNVEVPAMSLDEVELYFLSISELKRRYRKKIVIKSGLEVDFFEDKMDLIKDIIGKFDFDIVGGAVHFVKVDGALLNIASGRALKSRENISHEVIRSKYLEKLERMLDYDFLNMICHLDLIHRFKPSEKIGDFVRVLEKIKKKDLVVEINTGGFGHINKVQYPSLEIIELCYKLGIKVTIGSDAHSPIDVGINYVKALAILKSVGYKEIHLFNNGVASAVGI